MCCKIIATNYRNKRKRKSLSNALLLLVLTVTIALMVGCSSSDSDTSSTGGGDMTCTVSIKCDVILENMDKLDDSKHSLVPADGVILAPITVNFSDGETGADIIKRVTKDNKIHLDYDNSGYVKAINNLYEMDLGGQSGWKYSVNGTDEGTGCSKHIVKQDDVIEWRYVLTA